MTGWIVCHTPDLSWALLPTHALEMMHTLAIPVLRETRSQRGKDSPELTDQPGQLWPQGGTPSSTKQQQSEQLTSVRILTQTASRMKSDFSSTWIPRAESCCSALLNISLKSSLIKDSWASGLLLHPICYDALFCLKDMKKCGLSRTLLSRAILGRLGPGNSCPTPTRHAPGLP